jgi:hypothetical protein
MTREIADAFDQLAKDLKTLSREPTVGATESQVVGTLARVLITRAARLRSAADDVADAAERQRAAQAAEQADAEKWDPAEHTVAEVNEYLASASTEEQARVLGLEESDRPEVPEGKKQRTGILSGPHGQF